MRRTIVVFVVLLVLSMGYGCGSAVVNPEDDIVPTTTPIIEMMPNVVINDDITMSFESDAVYIVGTVTNKSDKPVGDMELTFNVFDAFGQRLGTAMGFHFEDEVIAPGESWSYRCDYYGKDFKRVAKAVVAGLVVH